MIAAEVAGYRWFVAMWRWFAPPLGIAAALGITAAVLDYIGWLWLAVASAGLFLFLLIEGAYRLWREALPPAVSAVLPMLEDLHAEGQTLKGQLLRGFVDNTLEAPGGLVYLEAWTTKVLTALRPIRPDDAFRIETEDAAGVSTAFAGTSAAESQLLNCLIRRLSLLVDVIARMKEGHGATP